MPNCGHAINIEDPDEFNRLVGAFLAQVDARPLADARSACGHGVDHRDEVGWISIRHDWKRRLVFSVVAPVVIASNWQGVKSKDPRTHHRV